MRHSASNLVTFLSDFGEQDGYTGIVRGVVLGMAPDVRVVDLTHEIPPQNVTAGALVLDSAVPYFPDGTVHLAVVDPGVGGDRRAVAIETGRGFLVGPDNGLLSITAKRDGVRRIVHLDRPEVFLRGTSRTFHGRDVFAPVAGRLARGEDLATLGSFVDGFVDLELPQPVVRDDSVEGRVLYVDHFGNLVTNVRREHLAVFRGRRLSVSLDAVTVGEISTHYGAVAEGAPLSLWNSWDHLEVAVRNGSAADVFRAAAGTPVRVSASGESR